VGVGILDRPASGRIPNSVDSQSSSIGTAVENKNGVQMSNSERWHVV